MEHWIVYLSPAGTTRHAAEMVRTFLVTRGIQPRLIDLGRAEIRAGISEIATSAPPSLCLWIGSPVYVDHALPLVHEFVEALPEGEGKRFAVPFVTWGGVTSGLALPEMAVSLTGRGFQVLGAAKMLALHSSMWGCRNPLGKGHPDAGGDASLASLIEAVLCKLSGPEPLPLDLEKLDDLPSSFRQQAAAKSLALAKTMMPPPKADPHRCDQCGRCAEDCPAGALSLAPFPAVDDASCIRCQHCVRECPRNAYPYDPDMVETRLQAMAEASPEAKETAVFL